MLLRGSEEAQTRKLATVGLVAVLCAGLVVLLVAYNPFAGSGHRGMSVTIDAPYVGQGVATGTAVILHGVKVGEVTGVATLAGGGVRLLADLQPGPVTGLTDSMKIDFRPINYFGVAGISISPNTGGRALRNGMQISTIPVGNYTLQSLLSGLGDLSNSVLTPQLIEVINRATRYIDSLQPFVETMLISANTLAHVQTISTAQLLVNSTKLSTPLPGFVSTATEAAEKYMRADERTATHVNLQEMSEEGFNTRQKKLMEYSAVNIFGSTGKLLESHVGDLLPLVDSIKALSDVVPPLIRPEGIANTLVQLRTRFEQMYAGTPEQRALQVRIVLDKLPGLAAPLDAIGGPE